jgi:RNA polymerase sigma-70 factor, ECF subfamily
LDLSVTGSRQPGHSSTGTSADQPPASHVQPAFDAIYREHFGFVWRVLRGMGVAEAAAEDAAQEVFVVVHRRLHEFEARSSLQTWLFEIALRVASNQRRRQRRKGAHEVLSPDLPSIDPTPADQADSRRALGEVLSILEGMDEGLRVVLVLALIEQLSAPEIGKLLNVNVNTVSSRLRRGREAFQSALERRRRRAR